MSVLAPPRPVPTDRVRRRVPWLAVALLTLAAATVVLGGTVLRLLANPAGAAAAVGVDDVVVSGSAFQPPVIQVDAGTTVTWTFDDGSTRHNVVGEGWSSPVQQSGTYQHTFEQSGSYPYTCTLHWGMDGRVEVVAP